MAGKGTAFQALPLELSVLILLVRSYRKNHSQTLIFGRIGERLSRLVSYLYTSLPVC